MKPRQVSGDCDWAALLDLLHQSFADMEGRIDPPSSLHRMSAADIAVLARDETLFIMEEEDHPIACMFLIEKDGSLYISKLAVHPDHQKRGLARTLITVAAQTARDRAKSALTLQTRVELTENHAVFEALGFVKIGETAHPGFDRPTSISMRLDLPPT